MYDLDIPDGVTKIKVVPTFNGNNNAWVCCGGSGSPPDRDYYGSALTAHTKSSYKIIEVSPGAKIWIGTNWYGYGVHVYYSQVINNLDAAGAIK